MNHDTTVELRVSSFDIQQTTTTCQMVRVRLRIYVTECPKRSWRNEMTLTGQR